MYVGDVLGSCCFLVEFAPAIASWSIATHASWSCISIVSRPVFHELLGASSLHPRRAPPPHSLGAQARQGRGVVKRQDIGQPTNDISARPDDLSRLPACPSRPPMSNNQNSGQMHAISVALLCSTLFRCIFGRGCLSPLLSCRCLAPAWSCMCSLRMHDIRDVCCLFLRLALHIFVLSPAHWREQHMLHPLGSAAIISCAMSPVFSPPRVVPTESPAEVVPQPPRRFPPRQSRPHRHIPVKPDLQSRYAGCTFPAASRLPQHLSCCPPAHYLS